MPEKHADPTQLLMRSVSPAGTETVTPPMLGVENYHVGQEIARGGMGSVLEAEDGKLKRTVAVKVMTQDAEVDPAMRRRFVREAEVLAMLAHPNIVPIYDIVWDDGMPLFYAMKKVQGQTLQAILNSLRKEEPEALSEFPLNRLLSIFRKACDAVAFAHSKGILHRDLKPDNIMVGEFGEVLVMDWGIAKRLDSETLRQGDGEKDDSVLSASQNLQVSLSAATLQGAVMGTPQYMSPEQAQGRVDELDERSDIYSLGAILYAILTLRPPVEGKTAQEVLEKVRSGQITAPMALKTGSRTKGKALEKGELVNASQVEPLRHRGRGRVPAGLSSVAMHALKLDKTQRYSNVPSLIKDIEAYQGGYATSVENAGLAGLLLLLIKRHQAIVFMASAAWLIITALVVWFILGLRASETTARQALARSAISLAEAALREGNGPAMQAALKDVPENMRDSTWRYLLDQSDSSFARIRTEAERIDGVVAHPRLPSVFAVVDHLGVVTILNVRTGERLLEFPADLPKRDGANYCLAITPQGERIAVGSTGAETGIVIHNARDGAVIRKCGGQPQIGEPIEGVASSKFTPFDQIGLKTFHLAFSPDGRRLAQTEKSSVNLWEFETGQLRWRSEPFGGSLTSIDFSLNGENILIGRFQGHSILYSVEYGTSRITRYGSDRQVLSPDGETLVSGDGFGKIVGVNIHTKEVLFEFATDGQAIESLVFSSAGRRFVSVTEMSDGRQSIRVWNAKTGAHLQDLRGGEGEVEGVALHPLSGELFLCGPDSRVWDLGDPSGLLSQSREATVAFFGKDDVVFAQDGRLCASLLQVGANSNTALWAEPENYRYNTVDVSADGRTAVVGSLRSVDPLCVLQNHGENVKQFQRERAFASDGGLDLLRVSPTGGRVAVLRQTEGPAVLRVHHLAGPPRMAQIELPEGTTVNALDWPSDERLAGLITANTERGSQGSEERIVVWDAVTGKVIRSVTNTDLSDALVHSPDGSRFAEGGADKRVRIRDSTTLAVVQEFRAHGRPISVLAWHPTRPILATGSADLTIRLWDLTTGQRIDELRGPLAAPHTLDFSPSGRRLGCASLDGMTRLWEPLSLRQDTAGTSPGPDQFVDEHRWFVDPLYMPPSDPSLEDEKRKNLLYSFTSGAAITNQTDGWKLIDGELVSPPTLRHLFPLPANLSDTSYSARVKLSHLEGDGGFILCLPVGDKTITFHLDGFPEDNYYTGLTHVGLPKERDFAVRGKQIKDSKPHELEVVVLPDGDNATITASLDTRPIFDWTGSISDLGTHKKFIPPPEVLSLGVSGAVWSVSDVRVKRFGAENRPEP